MRRFDNRHYVSMTMEFRCNLRCVHCMIGGTMDRLRPESDERFAELLAANAREARWRGLILTGAEITLRKDLLQLVARARGAGFAHVRIQSHGMALEKPDFCEALLEAGVDEFFISIAGSNAERHDAITAVPGSFARTMRGLENLDRLGGAAVLTNTVVTRRSVGDLPAVVDALAHIGCVAQMEFWNYWPMREDDEADLIAPLSAVLPALRQAVARARELGREVEIKNVPQCALGYDAPLLVNQQPHLYVDEAFWAEFARNGFYQCAHRERCASSECLGLTTAYIRKFGLEADRLTPLQPGAETVDSGGCIAAR